MEQTPLTPDRANMPSLNDLSINGMTPFAGNRDGADQLLAEAHALLTLLSGAYDCAEGATESAADAVVNIRPGITARALNGIATLIALAQHFEECADVGRAHRRQV
jgi:pyrroline-5-carboxylate reductase